MSEHKHRFSEGEVVLYKNHPSSKGVLYLVTEEPNEDGIIGLKYLEKEESGNSHTVPVKIDERIVKLWVQLGDRLWSTDFDCWVFVDKYYNMETEGYIEIKILTSSKATKYYLGDDRFCSVAYTRVLSEYEVAKELKN